MAASATAVLVSAEVSLIEAASELEGSAIVEIVAQDLGIAEVSEGQIE